MAHPKLAGASDAEIARICCVSSPFVASLRNPEAKERQRQNVERHYAKKVTEQERNSITPEDADLGAAPDEEELKASELAYLVDLEIMQTLLEASEPLKVAHEEIKRLNHLNGQLNVRIHALMNERNEAIRIAKLSQKEEKRLRAEILAYSQIAIRASA